MTRPVGICVDRYELIRHIADGSFAEVHLARNIGTGAEVVIKFPHASVLDHPELRSRWRRESELSRGLNHPNVERRLDTELRHSEPYLVVEYIGGGSLEQWLAGGDALLPIGQAVVWGGEVAHGLRYLHSRGIIHRDLKPANVMLTDNLEAKIADFGAATELSKRRSRWALPAPPEGTAGYLSPEQILGEPGDQRTDVYQWGVLMYEMLAGQLPFSASTRLGAMEAHLTDDPLPLTSLREDVPPALEAVVLKAIHRSASRRHASVDALLDDLHHLDAIDLGSFDLSRDPPLDGSVGASELKALMRIVVTVTAGFVAFVVLAIGVTMAAR